MKSIILKKSEFEKIKNKTNFDTENHYFECECKNVDHVLIVSHDKWIWDDSNSKDDVEIEEDMYIHVGLNHYLPWYKRLKIALKYIFGVDSKFCMYSETSISVEDAERMKKILDDYINSPWKTI